MKYMVKKIIVLVLLCSIALTLVPNAGAVETYTAPTDTIKVGLYYNNGTSTSKSFVSANLQNVTGYGYGYDLGYFDSNRDFVSIGAYIKDTNAISVMIDKNLYWDSSSRSYKEGTSGSTVVGCFHIQLSTSFDDYDSALALASELKSSTGISSFVKYDNGKFYVCLGQYTSSGDASSAAGSAGISYDYAITSGTAYTVTVTELGTNKILFEFDYGASYSLGVMPVGEEGVKTLTYYKNVKYYGAFSYVRSYGGNITVINYVNIEDYVKGVLPYEMSTSWPLEALKAQAVCARTYAMVNLNKHRSLGFDVCNTTDCQVYGGTTSAGENSDRAVDETEGMYLTYNGTLCETYFYSCNGGASENSENVWVNARAYLVGVSDPYEAAVTNLISNYNWTVTYTGDQIAAKLQNNGYSCSTIVKFEITEFTAMGNVKRIRFTDSNGKTFTFSKDSCRTFLGLRSIRYTVNGATVKTNNIYINSATNFITSLFSSLFAIGSGGTSSVTSGDTYAITGSGTIENVGGSTSTTATGKSFVITGSGWGHNVGLSQWGAYSMAKNYNKTYDEILSFYYTDSVISYSE
jgi:stage II sporulation protein D